MQISALICPLIARFLAAVHGNEFPYLLILVKMDNIKLMKEDEKNIQRLSIDKKFKTIFEKKVPRLHFYIELHPKWQSDCRP